MAASQERWVGVLGGGQLGRMLALEARRMAFRVVQWTGGDESGAERLADRVITDPFSSVSALDQFAKRAEVATIEFENIPAELLEAVSSRMPLMPAANAVVTCQNRHREKSFLEAHGIPTTPFRFVDSIHSLEEALQALAADAILKTAESGYDGKGQRLIAGDTAQDKQAIEDIWQAFNGVPCVLEQKVALAAELSVIVARSQDGVIVTYDPAENLHHNHILALSIVPARISSTVGHRAQQVAEQIVRALDYVGVMGVEFFVDTDGNLLVNELAPRPHNSGHHTLDACETSQFEQQLRATCGLPLGSTRLTQPVVMWNLLGDLWRDTTPPDWNPVLSTPGATLHLYGKRHAKPGRKMGHVAFVAGSQEEALQRALACRTALRDPALQDR